MKKKTNMITIIISAFILNYFMLIPSVFAATDSAVNKNFVLNQEQIKAKVNEVLVDFGRKMLKNLTKSLGISVPVNQQTTNEERSVHEGSLKGKKIVVDPGHGGNNPGAVRYSLRESDNNLSVGLKLKTLLEKQGAKVIMTRTTDTAVAKAGAPLRDELQARVDVAERNKADAFISIHTNSNENTTIKGAMTFYYHEASKGLAQATQEQMVKATNAIDKGIDYGNFLVLRNSQIPAVLVEMGFITNQSEALKLNEDAYRNQMATGIANGISRYFEKNK